MNALIMTILIVSITTEFTSAQETAKKFSDAEETWHIGFTMSTTRYCGDLSERYQFRNLQLDWAAETHIRYRFTYRFSCRADIGLYRLRGDQQYTDNKDNRLSFTTLNPSFNLGVQWDFRSTELDRNVLYLIGFTGVTRLNPEAIYQNVSYKLAPLQTEGLFYAQWVGQGGYGLGVPFVLSRRALLRTEAIYTHVFSDYVDDVSYRYVNKSGRSIVEQGLADRRAEYGLSANPAGAQRGNSQRNDGYIKFGVQLSVKL
jgi:hypothetical protein